MEFLNAIPLIGPVLFWVLPFLVVLSIVVAIHELGHLMVGRWCGIKAEVYSIGFGKVLWSRTDKHGTVWQIAALPLGGFVKFLGDMDPASAGQVNDDEIPEEDRPRAFHNAALYKRALTVLAGPVANFILSVVIFTCLAFYLGKPSDEPVIHSVGDLVAEEIGLQAGDRVLQLAGQPVEKYSEVVDLLARNHGTQTTARVIRDGKEIEIATLYANHPMIGGAMPDGAALAVGMRPGDSILEIDGTPVYSVADVITTTIALPHGKEIVVAIDREGERKAFNLVPELVERDHPVTGKRGLLPTLGISMSRVEGLQPTSVGISLTEAVEYGALRVWGIISDTVTYVGRMLFHGATTEHLSGPIGIAKYSAEAAERGPLDLINMIAMISTAIGFLNLFPIPVLDGGHLVFYLVEAIRGKPTNEKIVHYGSVAGLSLLLLLMVFVTFNNDLGLGAWLSQN